MIKKLEHDFKSTQCMLVFNYQNLMSLTKRGRGRPKSKIKALRDKEEWEQTMMISKKYNGMYADVWLSLFEGQRSGFAEWCSNWCSNVVMSDGETLLKAAGNCVFDLVDGICVGNDAWYTCTKRQFMFQIADICIILHATLSLVEENKNGTVDCMTVKCILCCPHQFLAWTSDLENKSHGDILSAGECSVLNFRRVMQDGVCFHAHHRLAPQRADKWKSDQIADLLCFSTYLPWSVDDAIHITMRESTCILVCGVLEMEVAVGNVPLGHDKSQYMIEQSHLVNGCLGAHSRGKVIRHLIGRMKTLIGHNNTIPVDLVKMLNPTLTQDMRRRDQGFGPFKWAEIRDAAGDHDMNDRSMKTMKKLAKAELCKKINAEGDHASMQLLWGMFGSSASIIVHEDEETKTETINTCIIEVHQDKQYYGHMRKLFAMKCMIFNSHWCYLLDDDPPEVPACYDIQKLDVMYTNMLATFIDRKHDGTWLARHGSFFTKKKKMQIGAGFLMCHGENAEDQSKIFKCLEMPVCGLNKMTDKRYCFMKDPDGFGFSWVPKCKRRRIEVHDKKTIGTSTSQPPTITAPCVLCKNQVALPVVMNNSLCCLRCMWDNHIGPTSLSLCDQTAECDLDVISPSTLFCGDVVAFELGHSRPDSGTDDVSKTAQLAHFCTPDKFEVIGDGRYIKYEFCKREVTRVIWFGDGDQLKGNIRICNLLTSLHVDVQNAAQLASLQHTDYLRICERHSTCSLSSPSITQMKTIHDVMLRGTFATEITETLHCTLTSLVYVLAIFFMIQSHNKRGVLQRMVPPPKITDKPDDSMFDDIL